MSQGWILLHRQLQDCWIWNDKPYSKGQAWVDLLLSANHKEKKIYLNGELKIIQRGQFHTSLRKLADRWGWNVKTVKKFLNLLENDKMIHQECSRVGNTITIEKYSVYQDLGNTDYHTEGYTVGNTVGNTEGYTVWTQTNNEKKEKKEKNVKNEKNNKLPFGEFQNVKLTQEEYDRLGNDYGTAQRKEAIKYLDEYIEEKGYKSKSHNLSIRRWVIKAIAEHSKPDPKEGKSEFMLRLQEAIDRKEAQNAESG